MAFFNFAGFTVLEKLKKRLLLELPAHVLLGRGLQDTKLRGKH
jgi:hypothetical protein